MISWLKRIWVIPRAEGAAVTPPAEDDDSAHPDEVWSGLANLVERFLNDLRRIKFVDERRCCTSSISLKPCACEAIRDTWSSNALCESEFGQRRLRYGADALQDQRWSRMLRPR